MIHARKLLVLCRGDSAAIATLLEERDSRWLITCALTIVIGCALYGGTVGLWRAPMQGVYTAVKMPLLIFLTCAGNALLNGIFAQVLGSGLSFRQTWLAILMSFTIASIVLAAFTPVALFLLWNTPPLASAENVTGHSVTLLCDVAIIAYAGLLGNRRLLNLLTHLCPSPATARRVFWSWLAGNLLLGTQLSYVFRPFIGNPLLPVEFLRPHPMQGNFFEVVFNSLQQILS